MGESRIDLSIVVPVYNAEGFIEASLDELVSYLASCDRSSELIVVDDGSSDATAEIVTRIAAGSVVPIRFLQMETNQGKGAAVTRGMNHATGRQRIFVDADLAFPPTAIEKVCDRLDGDADVVVASRVHAGSKYLIKPSFFRYLYTRHLAGRFFNFIVRLFLLPGIRDSQAGLKGFSADAASALFGKWSPSGFGFDLAILARARSFDFKIVQVPVLFRYDSEPTTVRFLADTVLMLRDIARVRLRIGGPTIRESLREFSGWIRRRIERVDGAMARPTYRSLGLAACCVGIIGVAVFRLWLPSGSMAVLSWLLALVAFLLLTRGADEPLESARSSLFSKRGEGMIFVLIFALTAFLRLWHLGDAPPMIHGDSAECGLQGLDILRGRVVDVFDFSRWYNTPYFAYLPYAVSFATAGLTIVGLRLPTAVLGILAMIPLYFMVRSWFGTRAAQIAATLYAVSHAAIHFGRIGLWNIQTLFLELIAFALLMRALRIRKVFPAAAAGIAAGLALFSYTAGRLILVVGVAFFIIQFLQGNRRLVSRLLIFFLLGATITAIPLFLNYVKSPHILLEDRTGSVMVLSESNRVHLAQEMDNLSATEILWRQTRTALAGFATIGDASGQYGTVQPLLSWVTAFLAAIGFLIALLRIRQPPSQFLILWTVLGLLLSSILVIDPPFYPRLIVLFPVPFIFAASALETGLSRLREDRRRQRWAAAAICLAVLAQSAYFSLTGYRRYLVAMDVDTIEWDVVEVFERVGTDHDYYLFGGPTITVLLPALELFADDRRVVVGFTPQDVPADLLQNTVFIAFSSVIEDHTQLQQLGTVISERFPQTHREVTHSHNRRQLVLFFSSPLGGSRARPGGANAHDSDP